MHLFKALLVSNALIAFWPGSASAQIPSDVASLDVRPGWRQADGNHMAALDITLAPGWKTYWRSPGDGGIPPRLMLEPNGNIRSIRMSWPVPEVFDQNGLRSIGYTDTVTIPLVVSTLDSDAPVNLTGRIEIGVCDDICIPVTFPVNINLPASGAIPDLQIRAALADRPMTAREAGLSEVSCSAEPIADGLRVTAQMTLPRIASEEAAVFELINKEIWISEADTERNGRTLTAVAEMVPPNGKPFALDRSTLRITVIGGGQAVDIRGC